jgi:hypothetical protein
VNAAAEGRFCAMVELIDEGADKEFKTWVRAM